MVILVSDGEANVDAEQTIPEAVRLKNEGMAVVKVLAIGASSFINLNVLRSVASRPAERNIYNITSFNSLPAYIASLIKSTCNGRSAIYTDDTYMPRRAAPTGWGYHVLMAVVSICLSRV